MRRLWFLLLVSVLLAACGSAPQQAARRPSVSTSASRTYQPPPGFPNFVDHSIGREEISIQAMALVGVPYRWGGNTPDAGFDCSGLVRYVVDRAASVNLPRTTAEMSGRGDSVEPDEIAPGDLIFFNTTGRAHSHVGIYVGKLRFVNAPSTGGTVRLDYLTNPYWARRFDGIRRVAAPKASPFDGPTYLATPAQPVAPAYAKQSAGDVEPAAASVNPAQTARADAFEPPPSAMSAAQRQARAAGASAPAADAFEPPPPSMTAAQRQAQTAANQTRADAFEPPPASLTAAQRQAQAAGANTPSAASDPIQAAADAYEPPPARVMRASTGSLAAPKDDPIARFAN